MGEEGHEKAIQGINKNTCFHFVMRAIMHDTSKYAVVRRSLDTLAEDTMEDFSTSMREAIFHADLPLSAP